MKQLICTLLFFIFWQAVLAQDSTIKTDSVKQLEEVTVHGRSLLNSKPLNVGKASISPMDLPQGVSVVGSDVIRQQQSLRLSDIVKNVNGVYLGSTRGSTQEAFFARGYGFSNTNMFKNGFRVNSGAMPEVSSLERVEVLKGSAAILYGNVAPGGILNMVTKRPDFERGAEISMRAGSNGLYKPMIDVYGPLSSSIAYRVNGTFEKAGSYRDVVHSTRYYVNPSLLFKAGDHTEILVQADHLHHQFTPDFGIGTYDNTKIPSLPRSAFFGTPWQYCTTEQSTASVSLKQGLGKSWELNASASYQLYTRDYYSTERIQAAANGDWARPLNKTKTREDYYIGEIDITGKLKTGFAEHILLAGIDADRYFTKAYTYDQPTVYDTINIFNRSKFRQRTDMPFAREIKITETPVYRFGAYVQDLISLSSRLKLLAGIRWSYQDARPVRTTDWVTGNVASGSSKADKAFSPRVGLVYKPFTFTSVFASYSNSFSVNSGTDVRGNALAPSIIDQYEAGVKNDFLKGALSVNITAYRIINNNLAQTAQFLADGVTPNNNTNLKELTGQTTSDGMELDVAGRPAKGLNVMAGYSYNYMRYTRTPKTKGSFIEGERLISNPAHTANASINYVFAGKLMKGARLGVSGYYTGNRMGGFNNTVGQAQNYSRLFQVSGYTTVDVNAGYSYKKLSLFVKLSNITNTYNYYVHENYSINPIAPRQLITTVSYNF